MDPGRTIEGSGETRPRHGHRSDNRSPNPEGLGPLAFDRRIWRALWEHIRAWLEFLPHDSIRDWADLKRVFIKKFQGTYVCPGNSWDLKSCQ